MVRMASVLHQVKVWPCSSRERCKLLWVWEQLTWCLGSATASGNQNSEHHVRFARNGYRTRGNALKETTSRVSKHYWALCQLIAPCAKHVCASSRRSRRIQLFDRVGNRACRGTCCISA